MSDKKQELHSVQLLKDHKHAGKKEPAGKTIKVNILEKRWMQAHQIVAPDDDPKPAATATPVAAAPSAKKG